jgi:two-component system response regulator FixJ
MDMNLTHAPAMELLRIVNAEPERFEVIVIDGQPCVEIAVDAMKFGAIDYLVKPVDEIRLFGAIENAVARLQVVRAVSMKNIEARRLISKLSPRERIVLGHLTLGSSSKNIAHDLDLSIRTVDAHRANIVSKLEVPTLAQALRIAFEAGDF